MIIHCGSFHKGFSGFNSNLHPMGGKVNIGRNKAAPKKGHDLYRRLLGRWCWGPIRGFDFKDQPIIPYNKMISL
ncbi:uncharacterized protein Dvar_53010 [Desulfosarcina variabilis str. Montpellier]